MGTLPPAISGFSPEKLPFGRMVQLSITAPTIGGWDATDEDTATRGIYGPCPIGSLPVLIDTYIPVGDKYANDNDGYAGPTFTEPMQPWQFHPQSPVLQPYLVDPDTAPWNGPRRIQYWDKVEYDYSTNNSLTGLSGTGPRLLGNESDGQIVVTASEDRPVPYVTWLNLSLNIYWQNFGIQGKYTLGANGLANVAGPTVGIVRHSAPADNVDYRLVACQEITDFFVGDLFTTDLYKEVDEGHLSHWSLTMGGGGSYVPHIYRKQFVSLFAFDVVPPNKSYIIQAGWQHPTKNDWVITSIPRDQMFGQSGNGAWTYTSAAPTTYNPDGTRWSPPMNRFGVMTF